MRATPLTAILALALSLSLPAYSAAEVIVPPGNSAAAQYTEAFPTASGERDTEKQKQKRSPQKVLGEKGSKQLQSKGKDGEAVAEIVAETSPAPDSAAVVESSSSSGQSGSGSSKGGNPKDSKDGGDGGSQQSAGGGSAAGGGNGGGGAAAKTTVSASGSSGVGEAVGQATGSSSSDGLGILLPLILVGGLVWAIIFAWRRRQQDQRVA